MRKAHITTSRALILISSRMDVLSLMLSSSSLLSTHSASCCAAPQQTAPHLHHRLHFSRVALDSTAAAKHGTSPVACAVGLPSNHCSTAATAQHSSTNRDRRVQCLLPSNACCNERASPHTHSNTVERLEREASPTCLVRLLDILEASLLAVRPPLQLANWAGGCRCGAPPLPGCLLAGCPSSQPGGGGRAAGRQGHGGGSGV